MGYFHFIPTVVCSSDPARDLQAGSSVTKESQRVSGPHWTLAWALEVVVGGDRATWARWADWEGQDKAVLAPQSPRPQWASAGDARLGLCSALTWPTRPAACLRPGYSLCQRNPAACPDGQLLCSITPRNGMFLKLFTLQLLLLFKSVLKIAWSRAFWFAFPRSEAVGSASSARALGGGQLCQKARLLCNASRCLHFESRVNAGLVP